MEQTIPFSPLIIRLFGPMQVRLAGEPLPRLRARTVEWLLALLVLRCGRAVDRVWLSGTLWPDSTEAQALHNLRNALVSLRQALGSEAGRLQSPTRNTLIFALEGADVDVAAFDRAIQVGDDEALRRAVALCTAPLLEDCYEEWVLQERQMRAEQCLTALECLAERAYTREDYREAIRYLRQVEMLNPLRESALRRLMACLSGCGEAAAAGEAYRRFRQRLHEEMMAAPDRETTLLYQQIRAHARETAQSVVRPLPPSPPFNAPSPSEPSASPPPSPAMLLRPPHPLTRLIGREAELEGVRDLLAQNRLVTLTGAGGVGKTRLAMEAATQAGAAPGEGAAWVELAPLQDGALLLPALAEALGLEAEGAGDARALLERIVGRLSEGACLLALDNCEHLLDAAARLAQTLLARCPGLCILATSRQRLGLPGEIAWRVPSLTFPPESEMPAVPLDYPAVRLFIERAVAVRPGFRLTGREDVEAVCRICRRLDGIPLALELAAARAAILRVTQIAARLEDRFRLLTGGNRAASPRHQTLQALIDWSHDQLSVPEQALLRGLSVFVGGWTLEATEAIFECRLSILEPEPHALQNPQVLDLLASLEDKSLVLVEETAQGLRYRTLETVREYGRVKLIESGEERIVQERHAEHFLALAEQACPWMEQRDRSWLDRLNSDHDNLRAALTFLTRQEETIEQAVRLVVAIDPFWSQRGHFHELHTWLLSLAQLPTAPTLARARLLSTAGTVARDVGDFAGAKRMFVERLEIWRQLGDRRGIAAALNGVASALGDPRFPASEYDPAAARLLAEESLGIMEELGDKQGMAHSLYLLGHLARNVGDDDLARARWMTCHALDQELGNQGGHVLYSLGDLALTSGDLSAARQYFEAFLVANRALENPWMMSWALRGLCEQALAEGTLERAVRLLSASLALHEVFAIPMSVQGRARYETLRDSLRERLDDSAYEVVWAEGCAMTTEQAISYALEGPSA